MSIFAIDVGGTAIKTGLFDEGGTLLSVAECPTEAKNGTPALIAKICALIEAAGPVSAVGISSSGQVDPKDGHIIFATEAIPGYTGTPLGKIVSERTGLPVSVDNDVNCAAMGEARFGAGRADDTFLCLTYGTGIGGSIVMGGQVYYGLRGNAGEFGHMIVHGSGHSCVCGKRGCYEMYASTTALVRDVYEETDKRLSGREIFEQFGDPVIREVIDNWIDEIVLGLVSLSHIFSPPLFILGGGIMNETYVFEETKKRLNERVIQSFKGSRIVRAEIGNNAGIYGAYWNALKLVKS